MSSFDTYMLEQTRLHPAFGPQDALKLCYQATFGAEHLLQEAASVKAYFEKEFSETPAADLPLFEMICREYGRVNLAAWKHRQLPAEWLFQIFFMTASIPSSSSATDLYSCFNSVTALAKQSLLPFALGNWKQHCENYKKANIGAQRPSPVHHSAAYRTSEKPAYRIVHAKYLKLIPLLQAIAVLPTNEKGQATVITIDGRAASGKSTLADQLTTILQAGLIHMDDFFLPPVLRSEKRLAEAGGNVHYERFAEEVLPQLRKTDSFSYTCFDCSRMAMGDSRTVSESHYRIVEGSYSNHPSFGDYADLKILCDIDPKTQMQRIFNRNGEELAEMFRTRWIPMEENYFLTFNILDKSDLIYNTN